MNITWTEAFVAAIILGLGFYFFGIWGGLLFQLVLQQICPRLF